MVLQKELPPLLPPPPPPQANSPEGCFNTPQHPLPSPLPLPLPPPIQDLDAGGRTAAPTPIQPMCLAITKGSIDSHFILGKGCRCACKCCTCVGKQVGIQSRLDISNAPVSVKVKAIVFILVGVVREGPCNGRAYGRCNSLVCRL
jgi:hypothetical protein